MSWLEPVPLEKISLDQLAPLIEEEIAAYLDAYRWDFTSTASLVRQLVATHSLAGIALLDQQQVVGYSYFVIDDAKAVIGDAFLRDAWASPESERLLMASSLEALRAYRQIRRIESQPMMLRHPYSHPRADRFERLFLEIDLRHVPWPSHYRGIEGLWLDSWNWRREEDSAQLLFRSYRNHIDASINDQYRMLARTRAYLSSVLRYPSCGHFHPEASFLLSPATDSTLSGLILSNLADLPTGRVGHISQLAIDTHFRHRGAGRMLLFAALARFSELGCSHATLTVTSANSPALSLYQSLGFTERSRLWAYVWPLWPV